MLKTVVFSHDARKTKGFCLVVVVVGDIQYIIAASAQPCVDNDLNWVKRHRNVFEITTMIKD